MYNTFDICPCPCEHKHVHEITGSVIIAEKELDPHNHRFSAVTGEEIPTCKDDHIHELKFRTDFYDDHFHLFCGKTSGKINAGSRHVHFIESFTGESKCHIHKFRAATLINDPTKD